MRPGSAAPSDAAYRTEAWDFIIAGGGLYNNLDFSFVAGHEDGSFVYPPTQPGGGSSALRRQLAILGEFIRGFDFVRMKPDNSVIKGGVPAGGSARALVDPGKAIAIYVRQNLKPPADGQPARTATLEIDPGAGNWRAEWLDTQSGKVVRDTRLTGSGVRTIESPPFESDMALRLRIEPQQSQRRDPASGRVFKDRIAPRWFANNTRFWYRNDLRGGAREFVLVDADRGTRQPAFDHGRLASTLSQVAGIPCHADRLPFDSIEFIDDAGTPAIRFKAADRTWKCSLASYECVPTEAAGGNTTDTGADDLIPPRDRRRQRGGRDANASDTSPDGKWTAIVKDGNLFIRARDGGTEHQLSQDGRQGLAYGNFSWSPDSSTLVAFRIEPGERKEVYLVESSPKGGGRATLRTRPYALPGDKFSTYELNIFDVASRGAGISSDTSQPAGLPNTVPAARAASPHVPQLQTKPEVDRFEHEWERPRLRWKRDGRRFTYQQTDRGHQRFRVIEVDARTGTTRALVDERSKTFIWTAHTENVRLDPVNWLEKSDEIIHVSERDGWRHLYLIDAEAGTVKTQITKGDWVVRGIERIDEDARQIWFTAERPERGRGSVFHSPLSRELRRHRPRRAHRREWHSHGSVFAGSEIPHRHLVARRHGAGP